MKHYEFTLTDCENPPMLEYEGQLGEAENLKRKAALIRHGLDLTRREMINDAIIYYKYLTNNTYFTHDYYPYRQLSMIYERTGDHMAGLVNIKRLFHANIYLNNYQFIWFTERLRQMIDESSISEFEAGEWIEHYQFHGALLEKKQNRFLADRFIIKGNNVLIMSEEEFHYDQEKQALIETAGSMRVSAITSLQSPITQTSSPAASSIMPYSISAYACAWKSLRITPVNLRQSNYTIG